MLVTDFLLCYPDVEFIRGYDVDPRIRPDAELTIGGQRFFVELDTGEQSYRQIASRQRCYAGIKDLLLYVTLSEKRMARLIRHSHAVHAIALFTTLEQVQHDACGEIWTDWTGGKVSLFGNQ